MRPYLAILRDSLREAMSSRTLPVLLVFFTVVLAALAPIGLEESVSWRLTLAEIEDQTLFVAKLRHQANVEGETPARRVLERLPADLKGQLGTSDEPSEAPAGGGILLLDLVQAINESILPDPTFYEPAAWDHVNLSKEARSLLEESEDLSEDERKRLNRLLLSAAFPGSLELPAATQVAITYLGYEISGAFAPLLSDPEIVQTIVRQILYAVCVWGIGPIGLLISIVVTADIMPRTFEPGSIDLLLSKPVNRSLVFLTKFLGACSFVLISFGYLVAGLWLIFGFRLGEWSPQLWGVLPLFMFSFAVIYSISAVVGLRYRSAIVSVFAAVFVWGAAFLLGVTNDLITTFRQDSRVERIVPLEKTVLVTTPGSMAYLWSDSKDDWSAKPRFWQSESSGPRDQPPSLMMLGDVLGPVYDRQKDRFITAKTGFRGTNTLQVGTAETGWNTRPGAPMPPGTRDLFMTSDGRLFAAGLAGLFEFRGDPAVAKEEFKIFGIYDLIPEDANNTFVRVDDEEGLWGDGMDVALDQKGHHAVVYRDGKVTLLRRESDESLFEEAVSRQLVDAEDAESGLVAISSMKNGAVAVAVAEKSGRVHLLDLDTLEIRQTLRPNGEEMPKSIIINPAGTITAVLFHDGNVWIENLDERPSGQGDLTAIAFDAEGHFWAADKLRRVRTYELPAMTLVESREGELETMEMIYRYGLTPLSYILPDTYGLRSVYEYLFTDEQYESQTGETSDLEDQHRRLQLREPLIQNALFLGVVLGLACLYVSRKDL